MKDFQFNEDVGGLVLNLIVASLIVTFTFGLGTPWAFCRLERWRAKNTTIQGRSIQFVGEGSHLLGKFIVWYILTFVTFGIYSFWMVAKLEKWRVEHTEFV